MSDYAELHRHSFHSLLEGASSQGSPLDRPAECNVFFDEGINHEGDVLDVATALGLVQKKGSHYSYRELRIGQGRDAAIAFLREREEVILNSPKPFRKTEPRCWRVFPQGMEGWRR